MKIDLIFLIVLFIVITYIFIIYKVEKMADVTSIGNIDQIKEAVKQVYAADVEAIRNLSAVATQLQAAGLTIPGQLKVGDKLSTNNLDPSNMPDGWGGGLRIFDGYASGTIGFGPDGKKLNAYVNSAGNMLGNDLKLNSNLNVADKIIANGTIQGPNGQMRLSNQGIMFGGPNADRETNSGQISAGLHIPNSLNIVGMSGDKGSGSRRVDMWAEGGLNVYGPIKGNNILCLGGTCIDESHLQMLTGARGVAFRHVSGAWGNRMQFPMVHIAENGALVKWTEGSQANFVLQKN